jgi:hypothetical protein
MAVVYKAWQPSLQRYVALKVLPPQFTFDPQFVARFQREARAAAQFNHPNIVAIHDTGEADGLHYIAMEYLEGGSLEERLAGRPMDLTEAERIVREVGSALDYAHERGLVHRDIKPANILFTAEGTAKVSDFGIVWAADGTRLTGTGVLLGTPEYMAPEQVAGGQVDRRADLYALGVVLYRMVTGVVPFRGTTPHAVMHAVIYEAPPSPRARNPGLSRAVDGVLLKALAKEPRERFQSGWEMAEALGRARGGERVAVPSSARGRAEPQAVAWAGGMPPMGAPHNITASVSRPAVTRVPPAPAGQAERARRSSPDIQARSRGLPAQRRRLVIVLAAGLLLVVLVCVISFFFWRPLPSLPSIAVAPVRYVVLQGDTLEAVADYFRVSTGTLSSEFEIGQPVTLMPGEYAILFTGQVVQMEAEDDGVTMQVANSSERKQVWVDLRASGAVVAGDAIPAQEDSVTVVGYPDQEGTLEAMAVDVWKGAEWDTWYHRGIDTQVWVYSAFHDQLVPPGERFQELEGKQVLLLGSWIPAPGGLRLQWDEQDLFVLGDDEVYVSWLSPDDRLTLAQRFAPAETPTTLPTGEAAEGEQTPPASVTPGSADVFGRVSAPTGLNVRADASKEEAEVGHLANSERVRILCVTQGEYVPVADSDLWYCISYQGTQEGYVLADFVELESAIVDGIPKCE